MKMMTKILSAVAALAVSSSAFAGFTATTGLDGYTYTGPGTAAAPAVGGVFTISGGTFIDYQPDGPADPQILANDLNYYRYNMNLTVVGTAGPTTRLQGSYLIFYDNNLNGSFNGFPPDAQVSAGASELYLTNLPVVDIATGTLSQTPGTGGPQAGTPLADLSYGGTAIGIDGGAYFVAGPGGGAIQLIIRVPEPTTLSALAGAGILGLRRRRA